MTCLLCLCLPIYLAVFTCLCLHISSSCPLCVFKVVHSFYWLLLEETSQCMILSSEHRVAISLARGRASTWACLYVAPSQSSTRFRTTGDGCPTSRYVRSRVPLRTGLRETAAWSACAQSPCSSTSIPKWRWTKVWTRSKSLTDRK